MNKNIIKWASTIQEFEGWKPGSRSFRNNNPGNIRYIGQPSATGKDDKGFCIFKTYQDGFNCLCEILMNACTGKSKVYYPAMTLLQFFEKYAPSSDNNSPDNYAKFVAKRIGVEVNIKIKDLIK